MDFESTAVNTTRLTEQLASLVDFESQFQMLPLAETEEFLPSEPLPPNTAAIPTSTVEVVAQQIESTDPSTLNIEPAKIVAKENKGD